MIRNVCAESGYHYCPNCDRSIAVEREADDLSTLTETQLVDIFHEHDDEATRILHEINRRRIKIMRGMK